MSTASLSGRLRGRQTQFYIEIVYGVLFIAGFAFLAFRVDPRVAAFEGGLVAGYLLRVWEKMSIYERILEEAVSREAADQVEAQVEEQVHDEVEAEVEDQVAEEVTAELEEQVPGEVEAELEDHVADEVEAQVHDEVAAEVADQVHDEVESQMADLDEQIDEAVEEHVSDED